MDKDYFSNQAKAYKTFRPLYPASLFEYLRGALNEPALVLDCATGSGQAALGIAGPGISIVGLDLSFEQLRNAPRKKNIDWLQGSAKSLPLKNNSFDLVIVAQALHWFAFDEFYSEINRVLKPGARFAAWTYSLLAVCHQLGPALEQVIRWFYHDVVGDFWPPERRWVDDEYRTIPFPFAVIDTPDFFIDLSWNRDALIGYVSSWSAVQLYEKAHAKSPIPLLVRHLADVWPNPKHRVSISWPLALRLGINE
ncbi:MAG: class I SAM-dependent methyltransferase [Gammaproteobacteria bacterium]